MSRRSPSAGKSVNCGASASSTVMAGGANAKAWHGFDWRMERFDALSCIGTKQPALVRRNSKSSGTWIKTKMPSKRRSWVVCVRNDGYEASLERRKIYEALPDADAEAHSQLRVIDESGEDYLFPARYFATIELPAAVRRALAA
jgi:hypothetical protein